MKRIEISFARAAIYAPLYCIVLCTCGKQSDKLPSFSKNGDIVSTNVSVENIGSDFLAIALDTTAHVQSRITAASKLKRESKAILQDKLIAALPGDFDKATYDTICVLGEIGDTAALKALNDLLTGGHNIPGKIGTAIHEAIHDINLRLLKK